jgi:hypothetical protein
MNGTGREKIVKEEKGGVERRGREGNEQNASGWNWRKEEKLNWK